VTNPLLNTKGHNSDTKENKQGIKRRASESSDRWIDFYATQTLKNKETLGHKIDSIEGCKQKIDNVIAGAAAEIRKKLANYNTATSIKKADLIKSKSYKGNYKQETRIKVENEKSPRSAGIFTKANYNLNTQRNATANFKSTRYQPFHSNNINLPSKKNEYKIKCKLDDTIVNYLINCSMNKQL